jgi:hypothetical protein
MSYLVVGTRAGSAWGLEVQGVGRTSATDLAGVESAVRGLLVGEGKDDAATADLQLLLPDFEVDLNEQTLPSDARPHLEIVAGVIALVVVFGGIAFAIGLLL